MTEAEKPESDAAAVRRRRTPGRRLFVLAGSTVLWLLFAEILLSLIGVRFPAAPLYPGENEPERLENHDPLLGWKLGASTVVQESTVDWIVDVHSNPQGFRSRHDFDGPKASLRIVFLGDSYTFGSGVTEEDTFVARIERRLEDVQCLNLGMEAFGIDQMWRALVHYGLPLEPDLVVLCFIQSDLGRSMTSYRREDRLRWKPAYRLNGGLLEPRTRENSPGTLLRFLETRSSLYGLWRRTERALAGRLAVGPTWRLNRALFESVRDDCAAAGVPLAVVHIPISPKSRAPAFAGEFADMGIPFLDLAPELPPGPGPDGLYFPNDNHLVPAGHEAVAVRVLAFLSERGLLP